MWGRHHYPCTINRREGGQADPDTGFLPETFHKRVEGGNHPQVVQHRWAQFARKPMDDLDGVVHQLRRAGDVRSRFLVSLAAEFFKAARRTLMPVKIWAMTSCSSRLIRFRSSSCARSN